MAFVLNDRVKETTTTTGTGTINLGGAATGFETFVAGIGNSNVTYYCIAGQGTAEFEVGIGTVTDASPDTLSRTTILSSSNSDSAVNFSAGTKDVFCTLPASKTIRELDTALNVPTGTTAQRASSPAAGDLRFNTTSSKFEGYSGSAWGNIGEGNFLVTNIFAGDGSDTTFTISNAVANENNLLVFIDGVFQAHDSYSVSGTTVTFSTAPANGRVITIYSALNNVQGADMVIATMTGDNSDTTLALGVTPVSENNVQVYIDGTYQNKDTYSISGQTLTFSTAPPTGTAVEAITHTVTDISAAASSVLVDEFTGDGSDTTFTLSAAPTNENNTQVFVGGVYQEKATYSISNAVLTFTAAPANGVSIEVVSIAVGQINSAVQLADADGDTKVMVEESSDEDTIRMDIAGTEVLTLTNSAMTLKGTTPTLTIGDAGAEDTKIVFDGNAQDFYVALDDSADDLIIGLGSTVGTTPIMSFDENKDVTINEGKLTTSGANGADNQGLNITDTGYSKTHKIYGDNSLHIQADSGQQILFKPNATEAARFDASGNLGIGTTAPTDYNASDKITIANTGGNASITIVGSTSGESSVFMADGTSGDASYRGYVQYQHTNDNWIFGAAGAEKVRLESTGKMTLAGGLGYVADDNAGILQLRANASAGGWAISARSAVTTSTGYWFVGKQSNGTNVFTLTSDSDSIDLTFLSDERMKMNITDSADVLDKVKQITVKDFDWRTELNGDTKDNTRETKKYGFIAQNFQDIGLGQYVKELMPTDESDDTLGMDYGNITPILVKAIQEQQIIIDDLKARITTLEGS